MMPRDTALPKDYESNTVITIRIAKARTNPRSFMMLLLCSRGQTMLFDRCASAVKLGGVYVPDTSKQRDSMILG